MQVPTLHFGPGMKDYGNRKKKNIAGVLNLNAHCFPKLSSTTMTRYYHDSTGWSRKWGDELKYPFFKTTQLWVLWPRVSSQWLLHRKKPIHYCSRILGHHSIGTSTEQHIRNWSNKDAAVTASRQGSATTALLQSQLLRTQLGLPQHCLQPTAEMSNLGFS